MKRFMLCLMVVLLLGAASSVYAKKELTGMGLMIGDTTGFTLKSYLSKNLAFDFAAGFSTGYEISGLSTQADLMWTREMIKVPEGALLFYFGGGAFWAQNATTNIETGLRGLTGAEYFFSKSKWAVFAELTPRFSISYNPGLYLRMAVGGRYYF